MNLNEFENFRSSGDPEVRARGTIAIMEGDERKLRKRLIGAERMARHKSEKVAARGRLEAAEIRMSLNVLARAMKRIQDEIEFRDSREVR